MLILVLVLKDRSEVPALSSRESPWPCHWQPISGRGLCLYWSPCPCL